ncbi:MAG: MFS transporter [Candidatus Heimdallarchaeota archaeon]
MSSPRINMQSLNIVTLTISHFLWGFVNIVFFVEIQPFLLSIYGTGTDTANILGFIVSLGTLSAVLPLLLGFSADRYGRKNLIILGELLSFLGLVGLAFLPPENLSLVLSIVIFNLGTGLYDSPLQGLIHESSTKRRGLAFSLIYNSSSIAGMIASLLIQIEGSNQFIYHFRASLVIFALSVILNLIILRDIKSNRKNIEIPLRRIINEPISRLTVIAFILDAFSWGIPLSIANGIFIILFGVSTSFIASLMLVQTFLIVLLQYPAGFLVDRLGRIIGLLMGELTGMIWILFVLSAVNIPSMAQELLIIAYAGLGISVAFWRPSTTISFIAVDQSAPSTNYGILAFLTRMGWVPTAAIGGFLFPIIGYSPLLIITFVGTFVIIFIIYRIDKLESRSKSQDTPVSTL